MLKKPMQDMWPSDNNYSCYIQELSSSIEARLGNADYDAVMDLCEQVYKTGYLDGVKDILAVYPG